MPTVYWTDYAGHLTAALREYEEIVCQVTEDIGRIITNFNFILEHTDLLILTKSGLPAHPASGADVEVRRVALDTIGQATTIRKSMREVHLQARGGLIKAKEMMHTIKGAGILSDPELEQFVRQVGEVREVLQQIRVKADDLIPAALDILELAMVLQKKVEKLATGSGPARLDHDLHRHDSGWHNFAYLTPRRQAPGQNRELHRLISLSHQKFREN